MISFGNKEHRVICIALLLLSQPRRVNSVGSLKTDSVLNLIGGTDKIRKAQPSTDERRTAQFNFFSGGRHENVTFGFHIVRTSPDTGREDIRLTSLEWFLWDCDRKNWGARVLYHVAIGDIIIENLKKTDFAIRSDKKKPHRDLVTHIIERFTHSMKDMIYNISSDTESIIDSSSGDVLHLGLETRDYCRADLGLMYNTTSKSLEIQGFRFTMSIDEADPDILTQPKFNITRLRLLESEAKISAFLQKNITHRDLVTQVHRYANYAKEMLARDGVYVVDYPGIPQWVGTSSDTFGYSIRVYTDIKNIITYLTEGHIQHWCEYRIDPAYSSDPASLKYMPISV